VHLRSWQQFIGQLKHKLKPITGVTVSIIDEVHHRRRYDEASARSVRQSLKVMLRWLWEIVTLSLLVCERVLQELVDITVDVCAI